MTISSITSGRSTVFRPDPEVEKRASANSEVTIRQMTPEEYEKYFGDGNKVKLTDSDGKELKQPIHLISQKEREEKQMATKRKGKWSHITKEFIETELAKGKTTTEIEKEIGMPKSGLYNLMYKYDIRSPHKGGVKKSTERYKRKISELEDEVKKLKEERLTGDDKDEIIKLKKELEESRDLNDGLIKKWEEIEKERNKLEISNKEQFREFQDLRRRLNDILEENERANAVISDLQKELDVAKGYVDMAQVGKVNQEGNDIVIKISLPREVVGQ